MDVGLHHLRAFVAVAETGSFTQAAARLFLSQPALSTVVKQLEESLGMKLFDRTTRRVSVTAQGSAFLGTAKGLLREFEGAIDHAKAAARLEHGHVCVATLFSVATQLIPSVFGAFTERYPGVGLSLHDANAVGIQRLVKSAQADFGVASRWAEDPELSFEPLLRDRFGVVCRADHPLAGVSEPVPWSALSGYPCFGGGGDAGVGLHALLASSPEFPASVVKPQYQVFNLVTLGGLLQAGLGVTVLPLLEVPVVPEPALVFRALHQPVLEREISLITRRDVSLSPAARSMRDILVAELVRSAFCQQAGVRLLVE
jgi:DNA-binding transcriptional LysR family regulator